MRRASLLVLLCGLSACTVGPDFERPAPPADSTYTAQALPSSTADVVGTGGEAQRFAPDAAISAAWWTLFRSDKLDRLVDQALKSSPTVDAAKAALRQARELQSAQWAAFFPVLGGDLGASRNKNAGQSIANPTNAPSNYYSLYTAQLSLAYAPDVFGANSRAVEAATAVTEATRFQLEATKLTLSSNVVVTAIAEASLRGQIAATERMVAAQHMMTEMIRRKVASGAATELDLAAQQSLEAQTAATLPPLEKQLAQTRDALTALLGLPSAEEPAERFELADLTLPDTLPVSLPSRLVEQRPDVRQAEETLHQASAQVGIALADMLPQFAITGNLGTSALKFDQMLSPGTGFWSIGTSLSQTLFDAGALLHRRRAADAALDQAAAQYRGTVIAALQNVADSLHAIETDARALKADAVAEQAAKRTWTLTQRQYDIGAVNRVAVMNAEQAYQQADITLIQARAARYSDTAGLFQALGGGWWNRREEAAQQ